MVNSEVEAYDHGTVLWTELFEKGLRRFFYLIEDPLCASTGIQQQRYVQRLFRGIKVGNGLFIVVIEEPEAVDSEVGNVPAFSIADDNRHTYKIGVDRYHIERLVIGRFRLSFRTSRSVFLALECGETSTQQYYGARKNKQALGSQGCLHSFTLPVHCLDVRRSDKAEAKSVADEAGWQV